MKKKCLARKFIVQPFKNILKILKICEINLLTSRIFFNLWEFQEFWKSFKNISNFFKFQSGPFPTWTPSLETIPEEPEETPEGAIPKELLFNERFSPKLFRFTSPSIVFTDADAKKTAGRDKTKAKIAKVKKWVNFWFLRIFWVITVFFLCF